MWARRDAAPSSRRLQGQAVRGQASGAQRHQLGAPEREWAAAEAARQGRAARERRRRVHAAARVPNLSLSHAVLQAVAVRSQLVRPAPPACHAAPPAEEELAELQEEFAQRLGPADRTMQELRDEKAKLQQMLQLANKGGSATEAKVAELEETIEHLRCAAWAPGLTAQGASPLAAPAPAHPARSWPRPTPAPRRRPRRAGSRARCCPRRQATWRRR